MAHIAIEARVRRSKATQRRDDNLRTLIAALRQGTLLRDDMRGLLGNSHSGCNKYLATLRAAGVLELDRYVGATRTSPGHPAYRLTRDLQRVDDFLAALAAGAKPPVEPLEAGRHVHIMADDCHYGRKIEQHRIPAPDPVLAAFYGIGQRA